MDQIIIGVLFLTSSRLQLQRGSALQGLRMTDFQVQCICAFLNKKTTRVATVSSEDQQLECTGGTLV